MSFLFPTHLLEFMGGPASNNQMDCHHGHWSTLENKCVCDEGWSTSVQQDALSNIIIFCNSQSTGTGSQPTPNNNFFADVKKGNVVPIMSVVVVSVITLTAIISAICWYLRRRQTAKKRAQFDNITPSTGGSYQSIYHQLSSNPYLQQMAVAETEAYQAVLLQKQLAAQHQARLSSGNRLSAFAPEPLDLRASSDQYYLNYPSVLSVHGVCERMASSTPDSSPPRHDDDRESAVVVEDIDIDITPCQLSRYCEPALFSSNWHPTDTHERDALYHVDSHESCGLQAVTSIAVHRKLPCEPYPCTPSSVDAARIGINAAFSLG